MVHAEADGHRLLQGKAKAKKGARAAEDEDAMSMSDDDADSDFEAAPRKARCALFPLCPQPALFCFTRNAAQCTSDGFLQFAGSHFHGVLTTV